MTEKKQKKMKQHQGLGWLSLDNAAKIYPAVRSRKWSANFRVSVTLKETVNPDVLQQALDRTIPRFPHFNLRLRPGFFWYYMEKHPIRVEVSPEMSYPCLPLATNAVREHMFRVCYYENRIALELFHIITDGTGAMIFLKTLTAEYLKLMYKIEIPCTDGVLDCSKEASKEELEDSFKQYAKFKALRSRKESTAYHYKGRPQPIHVLGVITGKMPVDACLAKARSFKVSLTEFLVAALIDAHVTLQKKDPSRVEHAIKVCVPVNLRNYYPSVTLRNFSLFVNPGIEPKYGDYTFEEILEEVHHFMRMNLKEKYLNAVMCKNLASEKNVVIRLTPLFLKNLVLKRAYWIFGEEKYSTTLSNIGAVKVPAEMECFIEEFGFILGRSLFNNPAVTAVSFGNRLYVTFSRAYREAALEREFFTSLVKMGIPVQIESNS